MIPAVSVVIPTHNSRKWISDVLATVDAQEGVETEIVVVDDGSTDGTIEWLREQQRSDLSIRYSTSVNVSRLIGVHAARYEVIAFLDHDDLWHPQKLKKQATYLFDNPHIQAVGSEHRVFTTDLDRAQSNKLPDVTREILPDIRRARVMPFHISTVMARRKVARDALIEIIGMQPQDGALVAEVSRRGHIAKIPEELTYVREYPGSHMRRGLITWSDTRLWTWHVLDDPDTKQWVSEAEYARDNISRGDRRNLWTQYLHVRAESYSENEQRFLATVFKARAQGRETFFRVARDLRQRIGSRGISDSMGGQGE